MNDNVIPLPVAPRPYSSLVDRIRRDREASKAKVQAMTNQAVEANRQREKADEEEYIRKHQRQLLFCHLRTMVRLCGKKWTIGILDEGKEAVEFMPSWLAE